MTRTSVKSDYVQYLQSQFVKKEDDKRFTILLNAIGLSKICTRLLYSPIKANAVKQRGKAAKGTRLGRSYASAN